MIVQGEVYLIDMDPPFGSEPGYLRPWVVIQNDTLNASRLHTVVAVGVTSNLTRDSVRGNVRLVAGEGGLRRDSVVLGIQLYSFDRMRFAAPIGKLSAARIIQIAEAIRFVVQPRGP